jgi:hypothetical protein
VSSSIGSLDELGLHLRGLELQLLDPEVRRNRARVAALLAEDFEEFGSSGRVWSRAAILELLAAEEYTAPTVENFRCSLLAKDVALVTYRTVCTNTQTGIQSAVLRSSAWVLMSKEWRMRFHQGTCQS